MSYFHGKYEVIVTHKVNILFNNLHPQKYFIGTVRDYLFIERSFFLLYRTITLKAIFFKNRAKKRNKSAKERVCLHFIFVCKNESLLF
jgi:hypothetical protein